MKNRIYPNLMLINKIVVTVKMWDIKSFTKVRSILMGGIMIVFIQKMKRSLTIIADYYLVK